MIESKQSGNALREVYRDDWYLAVSKPAGMIVHANRDRDAWSLETLAQQQFASNLILLHRLDRETTGIVLFARHRDAAGAMSRLFETRKVRKSYLLVVEGKWPADLNRIEKPIGRDEENRLVVIESASSTKKVFDAKSAVTTFRLLENEGNRSLVQALLKTGRTHQIRLHTSSVGYPVVGDFRYGADAIANGEGFALHAHRLDFRHPFRGEEIKISDPPPDEWYRKYFSRLASRSWA